MTALTRVLVQLHGCDDTTRVVLDLTEPELHAVQRLGYAVNAVAGEDNCKPTLTVAFTGPCASVHDEVGCTEIPECVDGLVRTDELLPAPPLSVAEAARVAAPEVQP